MNSSLNPGIDTLLNASHNTIQNSIPNRNFSAGQPDAQQFALFNNFHQVLQRCIDDLELLSQQKRQAKRRPLQRRSVRHKAEA